MLERANVLENHFASSSTDRPSMLTTRDPDIAEKVEAEDVWLQDLVQGSVVAPIHSCHGKLRTHDPDIASIPEAEDEWLQDLVARSVHTSADGSTSLLPDKEKEDQKKRRMKVQKKFLKTAQRKKRSGGTKAQPTSKFGAAKRGTKSNPQCLLCGKKVITLRCARLWRMSCCLLFVALPTSRKFRPS